MNRLATAMGALVLALAPFLVASPAHSASYPWRAVITFDKNWQSPSHSRLTWQLSELQGDGTWKVVETRGWRSGSGRLGRTGRNSCATSRGWLPNGSYRLKQHNDYPGNLIKGRAFALDDKRCPSGNLRHDLFIHTEQGVSNRQCPDRRGDQVCRWEQPRFNEYKSAGCIKLSPRDLAELVTLFQRHFSAGVRYPTDQVVVRVVN